MDNYFISLVGTQVMAVLNPFLALNKKASRLRRVFLLITSHDKVVATTKKLRSVMAPDCSDIEVFKLSQEDTLEDVLSKIYQNYPQGTFYFNLAGGMNYQVASAMFLINPENTYLLYPEARGVWLFKHKRKEPVETALLPLPEPVDVIEKQGLKVKIHRDRPMNEFLKQFLEAHRIRLPEGCKCSVEVNGIFFDMVVNRGNRLKLVKVISSTDDRLVRAREMLSVAGERESLAELYDRDILVLTDDPYVEERIRTESRKIEPILWNTRNHRPLPHLKKKFLEFLGEASGYPGSIISMPETITTPKDTAERGTFITVIGEDILPTIEALWSHPHGKAILLYTPDNEKIKGYVEAFKSHSKLLPSKEVVFYPTDIIGSNVHKLKIDGTFEANVTPGTKVQGAMLALYCRAKGGMAFSIHTKTQKVVCLTDESKSYDLKMPALMETLKLMGQQPKEIRHAWQALPEDPALVLLYEFLKEAVLNEVDLQGFPAKDINFEGGKYRVLKKKKERENLVTEAEINLKGKTLRYTFTGGTWFEDLVGYALLRASAVDEVLVGVKFPWTREKQERISEPSHKTEIDIVARQGAGLFAISCKSGKEEKINLESTIKEIKSMAYTIGRFVVSVLALFQKKEQSRGSGIQILDQRTLFDENALKDALSTALKSKMTT